MEDRNLEENRNDNLNNHYQQEPPKENTYYKPNFEASFTEPVRPERRQQDVYNSNNGYPNYYNSAYGNQYYGSNVGNYNDSYGNGTNGGQTPPKKSKKKRIALKVALGVFAAVFFGFGTYGAYEHFFVDQNNSSAVADKKEDNKNEENKGDNGNNKGALNEDKNSVNDVVVQNTTVTDASGENKVVTVSENTQPAIVAINSTVTTNNSWGQPYEATGSGSGIIIKQTDSTLLIATNNHVVEGASNIDVVFTDGESVSAKVKGTDSTSDLAVVEVQLSKIKKSTLESIKVATLGDSKDVKVGEMVVAIGNALGYGQSVTVGYISAKGREVTIDNNKMILLQTDAAINPGNSGGALLNLSGEVIGINSAKFASEEVEGIGYAIPISDAVPIINELVDREVLKEEEKGYIGISGTTVTSDMHTSLNYPYGVYVSEVAKDGAAEKAGIKSYDIITKLNGSEISTIEGFKERLNSYRAGTVVEITVQRIENGAYTEKTFKVTLQDKKVLDGLQSGQDSDDTGNNGSDGNDNNGGNVNPYGNDGNGGSDGGFNPYSGDDWPWSLFQ